jgi:hypothetical protein
MTTGDILVRALACITATLVVIALTGCASPYALPAHVTTPVGGSPGLVCGPGEVQSCRDAGHELRCTCAFF